MPFKITVKVATTQVTLTLWVRPSDSILNVKTMIQQQSELTSFLPLPPPKELHLEFNGKELKDPEILSSLNIEQGSYLNLLLDYNIIFRQTLLETVKHWISDSEKQGAKFLVGVRSRPLFDLGCFWNTFFYKLELSFFFIFQMFYQFLGHPGLRHVEYFHVRVARGIYGGSVMSLDVDAPEDLLSRSFSILPIYNKQIATALVKFTEGYEHFCVGEKFEGNGEDCYLIQRDNANPTSEKVALKPHRSYTYLFREASADEAINIVKSYRIRDTVDTVQNRLWKVGNNETSMRLQRRYTLLSDNCGHTVKSLLDIPSFYKPWKYVSYDKFNTELNEYITASYQTVQNQAEEKVANNDTIHDQL